MNSRLALLLFVLAAFSTRAESDPAAPPDSPAPAVPGKGPSPSPATVFRAGLDAYEAGDFPKAARAFREAEAGYRFLQRADESSRAAFNEGNALFRGDRRAEAEERWEAASSGPSSSAGILPRVAYNRGCLRLKQAVEAMEKNDGPKALDGFRQAADQFKAAILTGLDGEDAKFNLEWSQARPEQMLVWVRDGEDAVRKSEAALERGDFKAALEAVKAFPAEHRDLVFSLKKGLKETMERLEQRLPPIIQIREKNPLPPGAPII